ncbi:MAG: ATP-binding cassette domain-containing protein [Candidatus Dormibacteraeota bacterium]|nr:ATP-binding cassette domain-containing protein [Candidatus Dormibacteraeota bacterium]
MQPLGSRPPAMAERMLGRRPGRMAGRAPTRLAAGPGGVLMEDVSAGYGRTTVLRSVGLAAVPGETFVVSGPSGAGKTTLLRVLYCALRASAGSVTVDGVHVTGLPARRVPRLRRRLGFVFQSYELLPHLTALENVRLPLDLAHMRVTAPGDAAMAALELVALGGKAESRPHELSGGQQQRVAIARAIAHTPAVLLADEPTGNLDSESQRGVMAALAAYTRRGGTLILCTHDEQLRRRWADSTLALPGRPA